MAEEILEAGADLIISSVGALDDEKFRDHLVRVARQYERKIYITSGAIGGMDLMETYAVVGNPKVQIESIKPPESYIGTPYMEGKTVSETEEQLIFDGNVHDAIRGLPGETLTFPSPPHWQPKQRCKSPLDQQARHYRSQPQNYIVQ